MVFRDTLTGWKEYPLAEVIEVHDSKRIPLNAEERASRPGIYPYYGANGQVDSIDGFLYEGDYILVAEDGGYFDDPTRRVAYKVSGRFWVNNHAHVLKPKDGFDVDFLTYQLNTVPWMDYVSGTTRLKLTQAAMMRVRVSAPPLAEQRRLVGRIREMMKQGSLAKSTLAHVTSDINLLRHSLLHEASLGRLSSDWRAETKSAESAVGLLIGCEEERERRWRDMGFLTSEVAKKRGTLKGKIDEAELDLLPETWRWTTLADLAWDAGYGTSSKCEYEGEGEPVLRIPNVVTGRLDLSDIKKATIPLSLDKEAYLAAGDFLIVRTNGSVGLIGRAALVREGDLSRLYTFASYLIRYRLSVPQVLMDWVSFVWQAPIIRNTIEGLVATSAGQYNLSLEKIASVPLPIPPIHECRYLVAFLEKALSKAESTGPVTGRLARELSLLEVSILTAAFDGTL